MLKIRVCGKDSMSISISDHRLTSSRYLSIPPPGILQKNLYPSILGSLRIIFVGLAPDSLSYRLSPLLSLSFSISLSLSLYLNPNHTNR